LRHRAGVSADGPGVKRLLFPVILLSLVHCQPPRAEPARADPVHAEAAPAATGAPVVPAPISPVVPAPRGEAVDPGAVFVERYAEEDAYVVRGSRARAQAILFGGQCAQPQGYIDAIKVAAARRTQLVALQGDAPCNGAFRGWSFDLPALSRRIDRTFLALGLGEPRDVLLIGYSQGALVAERLAVLEPTKFTRFILMASPRALPAEHFSKATAVATMAGTLDRQDVMRKNADTLARSGVRARYFPLPGAAHGYMGTDPEGTFESAFAWFEAPPAATP
jgi:predicted esterase